MKWAVLGLTVLGLIAAACAALLVNALRMQAASAARLPDGLGGVVEVSVLYANRAMPAMTVIDSAVVVSKTMPRDKAPARYVSNPTDVVGKVLSKPIAEGQSFTAADFTDSGAQQVASVIPAGKRAVGISVTNYGGLEGLLYPGSMVDVMVSLKASNDGGARRDALTATLLENVQVLAIEQRTVVSPNRMNAPLDGTGRANDIHSLTLLVDTRQAKALELAMEQGTLSLALRNPLDAGSSDKEAVLLHSLFGLNPRAAEPQPEERPAPATQPEQPQWQTVIMRAGEIKTQSFPLSKTAK